MNKTIKRKWFFYSCLLILFLFKLHHNYISFFVSFLKHILLIFKYVGSGILICFIWIIFRLVSIKLIIRFFAFTQDLFYKFSLVSTPLVDADVLWRNSRFLLNFCMNFRTLLTRGNILVLLNVESFTWLSYNI